MSSTTSNVSVNSPPVASQQRNYVQYIEPFSTKTPDPIDHKHTESLINLLKKYNRFPSKEEQLKREEVLGKLDYIIKQWIKQVSLKLGLSEQLAEEAGSKLVTFGSYRLGVHGPGADIDTLCIAPRHVTRQHFFEDLYNILSNREEVTELNAVPDAHVPVIKMKFEDVQIDLLFAQLAYNMIPEDLDILNEYNLKNVDDETQRSLNGPRVADEILRLVPNIENFKTTLRLVKLWANKRGVYGNILGYLGGVVCALLTAKICQLYPNALPSKLLSKFFLIYSKWKWPNPMMLKPIEEGTLGHKVWNPKVNSKDRYHLMPVITPAYPSMNSTHNVFFSSLRVMTEEFIRGTEITMNAEAEKESWETLFEESDFFIRYKNYLQIEVAAENEEDHRYWAGYIESRLRFLLQNLEKIPNMLIHPYPESFDNPNSKYPHSCFFFIGLKYEKPVNGGTCEVDLTERIDTFEKQHIEQWQKRKDTMIKPIFTPIKRNQIPEFVFPKEKRTRLMKRYRNLKRKKKQLTSPTSKKQKSDEQSNGATSSPSNKGTVNVSTSDKVSTDNSLTATGGATAATTHSDANNDTPKEDATSPASNTNNEAEGAKENGKSNQPQQKTKVVKYEELEDEDNEILGIIPSMPSKTKSSSTSANSTTSANGQKSKSSFGLRLDSE